MTSTAGSGAGASTLISTTSSAAGWNAIVRGSLPVSAVELEAEAQRLTITFPAYPAYEIESPETITFTLPATATASGNRIFVSPAFRIRAASGGATISGRALARVTEEDIRQNGALDFEVLHTLTAPEPYTAPASWTGATGRISEQILLSVLPPPSSRTVVVICGPEGMNDAAVRLLRRAGYDSDMLVELEA